MTKSKTPFDLIQHKMYNKLLNTPCQVKINKAPDFSGTLHTLNKNLIQNANEKYPIGNSPSSEKLNRSKMCEKTTVFLCAKKQKYLSFPEAKNCLSKMLSIFIKVFIRINLPKNRKIGADKISYKDFNKPPYLLILQNIEKVFEREDRCKCLTLCLCTCMYTIFNKVKVKQMLSDKIHIRKVNFER